MHLTKFKQTSSTEISLSWSDGHEGQVTLRMLRDSCPCAGCKGETVLLKTYIPAAVDTTAIGRYALKGAKPVGNYALKLQLGDGHDMGMYTWEQLRSLCECAVCLSDKIEE